MLLRNPRLIKLFSTSTTSLTWRNQIKQTQLVSQVSSILLQRNNWVSLLQNFNLQSKLNPSLFLQIILKTQQNPQISLNFFNWATANLKFEPDLKSRCQIIRILLGSGFFRPAKSIVDSLIRTLPATVLVDCLIQACKGRESHIIVLSFVIEIFSHKGLLIEALEVFGKMRIHGFQPSTRACNALLDALQRDNEIRFACCFYGAMIRNGVLPDQFTWSLLAKILCKGGKFERIVALLDMGIYSSAIYNMVIDCYSKRGDFEAAFDRLNDMFDRKLDLGFSTYSSILDGACKCGNIEVIERLMGVMAEKEMLLKLPLSEYDSSIRKLCDLGKTYAAEMFFSRACEEKVEIQNATYGSMLRALSKEGRVKEAIVIYHEISQRKIAVNDNCMHAFVNVICKEDPSEVSKLLIEMIGKGFSPCASELSKCVGALCNERRWNEAEDMLNVILEKGLLPDSLCCCFLVERYCSSRQIDKAIALHDKLEKLKGSLVVETYNVLLRGLFKERRGEEAARVFDYMRKQNLVSSASFTIMVRELCRGQDLRKAMKIHDDMLKMGIKPDKKTYKRLISGFK